MIDSKKNKDFILLLLSASIAILILSCASTAPLPSKLNIVSPASDVPTEIAAFSGTWEGRWEISYGTCLECSVSIPTILVVERVDSQKANIIISIGYINQSFKGNYFNASANINPGPSINWIDSGGNDYKYTISKDLKRVMGIWKLKDASIIYKAFMTRR